MNTHQKCPKLSEPVRLRTVSDRNGRKTGRKCLKTSFVRSVRSVRRQKQGFAEKSSIDIFFLNNF